jgi:Glycosyltransferase family 87
MRQAIRSRRLWLRLGGVVLALLLGALLGLAHVALLRTPADFSIYYSAARVLASGGNPYSWHALQRVMPQVIPPGYVYPLWGLLPALAIAWLPLPVAAGVWLAASSCALVYAIWALGRFVGIPSRSYWLPALVGVVCLSVPGLFVLIQGQVSLLLLAALVGAYAALKSGQQRWAGVLLALALAKPQLTLLPALAIAAVAWRGTTFAQVARWAAGTLGIFVALSFVVRPYWLAGWFAAVGADAAAGGGGARALRANMGTIPALAAHLPAAAGVGLLAASVAAGGWLLVVLARRVAVQASPRTEVGLLAGAICVGTVLSPWMWIYDGVLWLVPLLALVRWETSWRRWLGLAAFWALPWAVRLWHAAGSASGGTSLNKLEDVLVAPLLLVALLGPSPRPLADCWRRRFAATPASASQPATRSARQSPSANTAGSAGQARRPATVPPRPSRRA